MGIIYREVLFLDFKQAFASIYRHKMVKMWQLQGIPSKLIRLIRMTLEAFQGRLITGNNMTESFNVNIGVRQGDALLFGLF